jgi:hypothetical protein
MNNIILFAITDPDLVGGITGMAVVILVVFVVLVVYIRRKCGQTNPTLDPNQPEQAIPQTSTPVREDGRASTPSASPSAIASATRRTLPHFIDLSFDDSTPTSFKTWDTGRAFDISTDRAIQLHATWV